MKLKEELIELVKHYHKKTFDALPYVDRKSYSLGGVVNYYGKKMSMKVTFVLCSFVDII